MYQTPFNQYGPNSEPMFDYQSSKRHFEGFYEDVYLEMAKFGEIEELYVCRNLGDHLYGNVYIKFRTEDQAFKALDGIKGRYYGGKPIVAELSPVTDFREARCRQYDVGECIRGGHCNFMHLYETSRMIRQKLTNWQRKLYKKKRESRKIMY